jgi:glycosyltransferase involved in cell wall biosynthesis
MTALISVLMPILNCVETLPFALASLQSQTHEEWECILLDDGSTDAPDAFIAGLDDPRIRYYRFAQNRGRGAARQHALNLAKGEYIAFLDGDDWVYPQKLRLQLNVLDENHDLSAVSSGMCISDVEGRLVGIRNTTDVQVTTIGTMNQPRMPPLAFAPSMMRAAVARATGFDPSFPTAEDADFLLRALLGRRYAVLPRPLYVYREQGAMTLEKVSGALDNCCRMFRKHFRDYPITATLQLAKARGKQMIYHAASMLGCWDHTIARRSRAPNEFEFQQHRLAWRTVSEMAGRHSMQLAEAGL